MEMDFYLEVLFPGIFCLLAAFLLGTGLRGVVSRKPFLISARWIFALIMASFSPCILQPLLFWASSFRDGSIYGDVIPWLCPVVFALVLVFVWVSLRGYVAFAVTEQSFREGLLAALKEMNLPCEETLASVRIPSVEVDLQVAVQSWIGMGQLKAKQRGAGPLLGRIVAAMNSYYKTTAVSVNLLCCVFYVLLGVLMAGFTVMYVLVYRSTG